LQGSLRFDSRIPRGSEIGLKASAFYFNAPIAGNNINRAAKDITGGIGLDGEFPRIPIVIVQFDYPRAFQAVDAIEAEVVAFPDALGFMGLKPYYERAFFHI
jgi:hypothetical protein